MQHIDISHLGAAATSSHLRAGQLVGEQDEFGPRGDLELAVDAAQVVIDRARADEQLGRGLTVAQAGASLAMALAAAVALFCYLAAIFAAGAAPAAGPPARADRAAVADNRDRG